MKQNIAKKSLAILMIAGISSSLYPSPYYVTHAQTTTSMTTGTTSGTTAAAYDGIIPKGNPVYEQVQITLPLVQPYTEDDFIYQDANRQLLVGFSEKGKQTLRTNQGILEIPNTVTTILSHAFAENRDITTLSYQENPKLQVIGERAFYHNVRNTSKLTKIIIANTVTSIGNEAFYNGPNTTLSFQENSTLRHIGDAAFRGNWNINITNKVIYDNKEYSAFPEWLEYIWEWAFLSTRIISWNLYFPDSITYIGNGAFYNSWLQNIRLSNGLTQINASAFLGNNLTTLQIPSSVQTIGPSAFQSNQLIELFILSSVQIIGDNAFYRNQLKQLIFSPTSDNGLTIWDAAFSNNKLSSIILPSYITSVGNHAFAFNNIYQVRSEALGITQAVFANQTFDVRLDVSHTPFEAINYINDKEVAIKELTKLANGYFVVDGQPISLNDYLKVSSIRNKTTGVSVPLDDPDMSIDPGNYDITFTIDMQKLDYQPAELQNHPGIVKSTTLYGYKIPEAALADNQKYFPYANMIRKEYSTAVTAQDVQDAVKGLPADFPVTNDQRFVILTTDLPDGMTPGQNPSVQVKAVYDDGTKSEIISVPVMIGDAPLPEHVQYSPIGTQLIKKFGDTITEDEVFAKIVGLPAGLPKERLTITNDLPTGDKPGTYTAIVVVNYEDGQGTDTVNVPIIVGNPKTSILDIDSVTFGYGETITEEELKKYAVAIISDDNGNIINDTANITLDMSGIVVNPQTGKVEPGSYPVTYTYKRIGYETKTAQSIVRVIKNASDIQVRDIIHGDTAPDNTQGKPGDMYVNTVTGDVYIKRDDNTWPTVPDFNMKGTKGDTGATGATGATGSDGKSAYEVWRDLTNPDGTQPNKDKSEEEYIASLKGEKGDTGATGAQWPKGDTGATGATGAQWPKGDKGDMGVEGKSAYDIWRDYTDENGNQPNKGKTILDFLIAIKWDKGERGAAGSSGGSGKSAYEIWRDYIDSNGNQPNKGKTEEDFLKAIKWENGADGNFFSPFPLNSASGSNLLPTQANLELTDRGTYKVTDRITPYICEEIIQVNNPGNLVYEDIANEFGDDIAALGMFRGVHKNENTTQRIVDTQGVVLNRKIFAPEQDVTRAEFVKMLVRSLACRYEFLGTDTPFNDVDKNMWYAEYIKFASENGWINGYADGSFRPNASITRDEAAKILSRAIGLEVDSSRMETAFTDIEEGSEFIPFIETLKSHGVMKGKTTETFEPKSYIPRKETARMIYRTFFGGKI